MSTRTFTFNVTAPNAPWYEGQVVNTWREISGTKLSDQPATGGGGPTGKQNAWCGWCINPLTSDVYSVGQGGHLDYLGNEVERIRLTDVQPQWDQVVPPSPGITQNTPTAAYYPDGQPCSTHGYHTSVFVPSINCAIRFPGGSPSPGGSPGVPELTVFNATTGLYDPQSTWQSATPAFGATVGQGTASYAVHSGTHSGTEAVYAWVKNTSFWRWNRGVPGTWTQLFPNGSSYPPAQVVYTGAACAEDRGAAGQVFFLGGNNSYCCHVYDIAANTIQQITLTGTDLGGSPGPGLVYVPTSAGAAGGKFYARVYGGAGSNVYVITPNSTTTWACSLLSTTGGDAIPSLLDLGTGGCPFTKFLYAPQLGGCVYGPRWGSNLWFLKLH